MTDSADVNARLSRLFVYPVKSCAAVELKEAVLTPTGLDLDRAWMVVDDEGQFVTQRELPQMALVRPQLKHHEVVLRAPGMLALHLAIDQVEGPARVRIWNDEVPAYDMGNIAAQWFSDFLRRKLRLVRFDPDHQRLSSFEWTGGIEAPNQFSDGYPLLVVGQASLDGLNARLAAKAQGPVSMERFRPNLVIEGLHEHDEDRLGVLRIHADAPVLLKPVKPCPRCAIPDIDPATAQTASGVSDALRGYRQDPRLAGAISFGMNLIVLEGADQVLRVGQPVTGNWNF